MANDQRVYADWVGGLVEDNPLASGATTLTSAGLAALPAIGSLEHAVIIFNPDGLHGIAPYAKRVTAHTAAATTATIEAVAIIGTAAALPQNTPWIHGMLASDMRGQRLDVGSFAAGADSDSTYSTSSTTLVDVDATNLVVTGTVPVSGELTIRLSGHPNAASSQRAYWGLRTASAIVANTSRLVCFSSNLSAWTQIDYRLTGLTPGAAFEYRFAHACSATNAFIATGPNNGPAMIEAFT